MLARALLKAPEPQPATAARGRGAASKRQAASKPAETLTLYRITGLGFCPTPIWLDHDGNTAAQSYRAGLRYCPPARASRRAADSGAGPKRTATGRRASPGDVPTCRPANSLIRNARLFDPRDLSVTPGTSVLIRGGRIVRIAPDADGQSAAQGAEIIDAHGRFLMPGLVGQPSALSATTTARSISSTA